MDIITPSVIIRGTIDPAAAIIQALCDFGTPEAPRTPSEAEKWQAIRKVRGELLAQTDYTMLPDAPPYTQAQVDAIAAYRQQLRDIPQIYSIPDEVQFPEMPI